MRAEVAPGALVNAGQAHRIGVLGAESVWKIPDGSWLAVRRSPERGTWVEVIDPECSGLLAFDFATEERLRSKMPQGAGASSTQAELRATVAQAEA